MKVIRLYEKNTDERALDNIVSLLKDGAIVIYPTDSVYAMGCDALNVRAVEKICNYKGVNPLKANLSIIGADLSSLSKYVKIVDEAIHQGYVLYPINYAAYDLLKGTDTFSENYTQEEKEKFSMYVDGQVAKIKDLPSPDNKFLREKILEMYSNPLKNKLKLD